MGEAKGLGMSRILSQCQKVYVDSEDKWKTFKPTESFPEMVNGGY